MSDVRNWAAFIRGRWDWTKFGYEKGFKKNCGFTDVDALVEFNGASLIIEGKQHDGQPGPIPLPPVGQMIMLRGEVANGKTALVLYGCGVCNNPAAVYDVGRDELFDFRSDPLPLRRAKLKNHMDRAMGLLGDSASKAAA